jgi:outer membrane scaffolding protein for murein synthesis (MipA/OmpV family)
MAKSRKGSRKGSKKSRKGSRKSRKGSRKGSRKSRKGSKKTRKGSRKSRKGSKKSTRKSTRVVGTNNFSFMAWYTNKPKINNRIQTSNSRVKLDDDDEWIFTGDAKANTKEQVQTWLRSLGTIKKYSGTNTQRLEVSAL